MQTESSNIYDNEPMVEAAVYLRDSFVSRAGRTPEDVAVEFLVGAFEMAEINYEVHYDFPVIHGLPDRQQSCGPQYRQWRDRVNNGDIYYTAKDTNVLLVDGRGGGCGGIGANSCAIGATWWDEYRPYALEGGDYEDSWWSSVNALLHEVGHNLGFRHDPDGGFGFVHNDHWHRTPTLGSNDNENLCGEYTEKRPPDTPSYRYGFYHWCAVTHFDIVDDDRDPSPPSTYPPRLNGQTIMHDHVFPTPPDPADNVDFDSLDISGGRSEVQFEFRLGNDTDMEIEADVSLSAHGNSETHQIAVEAGGQSRLQTATLPVSVSSETNVNACATVIDARYR